MNLYQQQNLSNGIRANDLSIVSQALKEGADARFGRLIGGGILPAGCRTSVTSGLLHFAATWGYSNLLRLLIAAGAEIDALDENSRTALSYALEMGSVESARDLIGAGASVTLLDSCSVSALGEVLYMVRRLRHACQEDETVLVPALELIELLSSVGVRGLTTQEVADVSLIPMVVCDTLRRLNQMSS